MAKVRSGLTTAIRYFYGVGDLGFALMTNVSIYYSTYFLTNVAKLSLVNVALITSLTTLIDACTSWLYGAIINSTKPMKWGRYRSWLVVILPIIPILFFVEYIRPAGVSEVVAVTYFIIMQLLCLFAQNFPYVANVIMINVVAKTPDDKATMASSRATWNNASKFAWSYLGVPFLAVLAGWFSKDYSYAALSCFMSIIMGIGMIIHFKMFKGYEDTGAEERQNAAKAKRARTKPMDLIRALIANPPLLILLIADLGKWCFNFIVAGVVVYYFQYVAKNPPVMATYTLVIAFTAVIGAYFSRTVAKKFGAKNTVVYSFLIMAVFLFIARGFYTNMWAVIILVAVAQLGYGMTYSCSSAMYADTAVYNEWKTGKNASGWIMGLLNVPLKVGSLLRAMIIPVCLAIGGFNAAIKPADAPVAMQQGICLAFMVIPGILLVICALVLLFGYRLTKDKVLEMQKEIDEKIAKETNASA